MSRTLNITLAIALTLGTAGIAQADAGHHGTTPSGNAAAKTDDQPAAPVGGPMGQGAMMGGGHHEVMQGMMQMMMQMHGGMMGGGMMGTGPGMMDAMGGTGGMGMMDRDMIGLMQRPMMGGATADANGDGTVSPDEAHGQLQALHAEADTDGDGALSLGEFEALHAIIVRDMMVDRFQHLDEDGDGKVTAGEMTAPADRMEMPSPRSGMMDGDIGSQGN